MNIHRRFQDFSIATATLAMVAFLLADQQPLLAIGVLLVGAIAWLTTRGQRAAHPWALPRLAVTFLVLGAIALATTTALSSARTEPVVSVLGLFLVNITAIKLFDRRSPRDDSQLLTLSFFDSIAAVLTGNSLGVGIMLVLLLPIGMASVVLLQFRIGAWQAGVAAPSWDARAWRNLKLTVIAACVGSALGGACIFVLAPRGWAQDVLGRFGQVRETRIGFNENTRLGQAGLLKDDPTPVMDVSFTDTEGTTLGAADTTLYLRGAVKDIYDRDSASWRESASDRMNISRGQWITRDDDALQVRNRITRELRISMRSSPGRDGPIFTLWRPIAVRVDPVESLRVNTHTRVFKRGTENQFGRVRSRGTFDYTTTVVINDEGGDLPAPAPHTFTATPIERYTRRVLQDAGVNPDNARDDTTTRQALGIIREHLRTKFSYTTEMIAPAEGQDPIEMFLFETKRGHCEYFASAMVAMCQSVGISSRMAMGYVATEFNPMTGLYLVRESNAHAWVEAHVGRGRWMTFDPSPPGDIERIHRPPDTVLTTVRRWWDALEFSWSHAVVSFDRTAQLRLIGSAEEREAAPERRSSRRRDAAEYVATWLKTVRAEGLRGVLTLAAPLLIAIAALIVLVRLFPSVRAWVLSRVLRIRGTHVQLPPGTQFYRTARRALARNGLDAPAHRSPLAHAEFLRSADEPLSLALRRIVELFYQARYGSRALTPHERAEGQRLAQVVHERARALRAHLRR